MNLEQAYADLLAANTDMSAHMPVLRELATGKRVIEFGTRRGVSTVALLAGLPSWMATYDLERHSDIDIIQAMADAAGIPFWFRQQDIDALEAIDPCDVVMIDAMHNGVSVAKHLRLGHAADATAMALHDTESFARCGDLPNTPGIMDAVDAFLAEHPEWNFTAHYPQSFGLTVVSRAP